jgi:hypothetical protein
MSLMMSLISLGKSLAQYLIVAGGGGGGNGSASGYEAGGGGAGGLLSGVIDLSSSTSYTITVGLGGAAAANGSNSSAFSLTAIGGGAGATSPGGGSSGGSGGGGSHSQTAGGAGTAGQGNAGATPSSVSRGGGGGGAGAVGTTSVGGIGLDWLSLGTYYAGGGAGCFPGTGASGGQGGGGSSSPTLNTNGTAGTPNTGGGGGAAYGQTGSVLGGAGGSGVVKVSYPGQPSFVGGNITSSGGNTVHTFISSGYLISGSYVAGLYKTTYSGYYADNVSFFATATPQAFGANPATSVQTTVIEEPATDDGSTFSVQWLGYFLATTTETYTFYTSSDDASHLWIGPNAITGFTTANATVNNGGLHGNQEASGTIALVAGTYYPIRIQFGEQGGGDVCTVNYSTPTITKTTTFTNKIFYNSRTNGH